MSCRRLAPLANSLVRFSVLSKEKLCENRLEKKRRKKNVIIIAIIISMIGS